MAYGISLRTLILKASSFVKKIFWGAKPGDFRGTTDEDRAGHQSQDG